MATCPHCGRYLGDRHRCAGVWRLRLRVLRTTLIGGLIGGAAGWVVVELAFGNSSWPSVGVAAVIGMLTVRALLRGEPPRPER